MSATLDLAKELINIASVTPEDRGCQQILARRLKAIGFSVESLDFGEVSNLWAVLGDEGPLFVFAGHTDVVPVGVAKDWHYPPFEATEADGMLWGRGAADMKGSLAAMTVATERFLATHSPAGKGRIGFLITSDEEGPAIDGTRRALEALAARDVQIDYCLVGEPSSSEILADTIKIGRRGSFHGHLKINGIQGHVAYPNLAANPIHLGLPVLAKLISLEWDKGNGAFPPTSLQISNLNGGTGATNVIPDSISLSFNLRYSTETDADTISQRITALLDESGLDYEIQWQLSGEPFLTEPGPLTDAVNKAVQRIASRTPEPSTGGGTSDGRFIAATGAQVVELGPLNATIHKVDECVSIADLEQLSEIYEALLEELLA